jgi:MFS superfamily sulfate permease-like transporter
VDWEFLRELKGKSRVDVITKFIVLILTVFTNLILSVFVGVIFYFTLKFFLKSRKDA